jgi:RHS repeat-associated protein
MAVTQIGSLSFTERFAYGSQFGRLKAMTFPSGEHVAYKFDDNGYLIEDYQRFTDGSELALRKVEAYSALGSINQQRFSNGNVQRINRNEAGSATTICTSYLGSCSGSGIQYLSYAYDGMGNLARQENAITDFAEDYQYDVLMRVDNSTKTIKGVTMAPVDYDYDAAGNILVKGDYGSDYRYGNSSKSLGGNAGPNALRQFIRSGTTSTFTYDNNGNRLTGDGTTLTYDDQNKPLSVVRNGTSSTFSYDANGNRFKQVKTQSGTTTTTYYVGSFEREVTTSATIDKTYIGDHTIKMKAVSGSLGSQSAFSHVLRDHLGSVDTLMDASTGAVQQYRGYDVFGRPRDIATGNNLLSNWKGISRGYTDHEHLNEQELIHMNGRIYDYNVGRFLSVDPFLQFPENSQSANPYSYILNNPMSGVDPTGYAACKVEDGCKLEVKEIKESVTGSRIKQTVGFTANATTTNSSGQVTNVTSVTLYKGNVAGASINFENGAPKSAEVYSGNAKDGLTTTAVDVKSQASVASSNTPGVIGGGRAVSASDSDGNAYSFTTNHMSGSDTTTARGLMYGVQNSGQGYDDWTAAGGSRSAWSHPLVQMAMAAGSEALLAMRAGGNFLSTSRNLIPEGSLANHLFKGPNKLADTPQNRKIIEQISNRKTLGVDKYGKNWYAKTMPDGTQIYTYSQNGVIKGAGVNDTVVDIVARYGLR